MTSRPRQLNYKEGSGVYVPPNRRNKEVDQNPIKCTEEDQSCNTTKPVNREKDYQVESSKEEKTVSEELKCEEIEPVEPMDDWERELEDGGLEARLSQLSVESSAPAPRSPTKVFTG